jgi:DNA-binding MarR family transcriptional regulator
MTISNAYSDLPAASGCTCASLRRLTRRMTALYDHELAPTGLRLTQYSLLATLHRQNDGNGVTVSDLASLMEMDRTTLTRNLSALVKQQLVAISKDAVDRRARRVNISDKGLAALESARPYWQAAQSFVNTTLGEDNVAALHDWVDNVIPALRSEHQGECR